AASNLRGAEVPRISVVSGMQAGQGEALSAADREKLRETVVEQLKVLFGEVTKLSPSEIDADEPLENYGIDSLMMTRLSQRLLVHFRDFSRTFFYEYPTLSALVEYLVESYPQECMEWTGQLPNSNERVGIGLAPIGANLRSDVGEVVGNGARKRRD